MKIKMAILWDINYISESIMLFHFMMIEFEGLLHPEDLKYLCSMKSWDVVSMID